MINPELLQFLQDNDYFEIREVPGRGICALMRQFVTVGLYHDLTREKPNGRYCYANLLEAKAALLEWDGQADPPGPWIKHKGGIGEYSNPATKGPYDFD